MYFFLNVKINAYTCNSIFKYILYYVTTQMYYSQQVKSLSQQYWSIYIIMWELAISNRKLHKNFSSKRASYWVVIY